jgi:type VI secretion system protein ImpE
MTAENYLKQGDLKAALTELQGQVRSNPGKADYRVFLFQLLAVLGQWDRALTQLNVAGELDEAALAMVAMYRQVIACERFREEVFLGQREPVIFGYPSEWTALLIQALKLTAAKQYAQSQKLRTRAFDMAPAVPGTVDGTSFAWLADCDSRLGPVLEAMIEGRYLWIPLERIASITLEKPVDLRDIIWLPAHFSWTNGGESYGVIPARYPISYAQSDPSFALSRKTAWEDCGEGLFLGLGQKILTTEASDYPLLEVRSLRFNGSTASETEQKNG